MSTEHSSPQALCALLNSGQFRLPLTHTRALDLTARWSGAKNWNSVAASAQAETVRAQAAVMRSHVNALSKKEKLSISDAQNICAALNEVESQPASVASKIELPGTPQWKRVKVTHATTSFDWQALFAGCPAEPPESYAPTAEHRNLVADAADKDADLVAVVESTHVVYAAFQESTGVEARLLMPDGDLHHISGGPFAADCGRGFLKFLRQPSKDDFEERRWFSYVEAMEDFGGLIANLRTLLPCDSIVEFNAQVPAKFVYGIARLHAGYHNYKLRVVEKDGVRDLSSDSDRPADCGLAHALAHGSDLLITLPGWAVPSFVCSFHEQAYAYTDTHADEMAARDRKIVAEVEMSAPGNSEDEPFFARLLPPKEWQDAHMLEYRRYSGEVASGIAGAREKAQQILSEIVTRFIPYVDQMARAVWARYTKPGGEQGLSEIRSEGLVGLMEAIRRCPNNASPLCHYASKWIMHLCKGEANKLLLAYGKRMVR